jgi:hypothetical protein
MAPKPKPRLAPIKVKPSGGITAWHASPHQFDQFDSQHIGTGEGAQAYGHGLYFAGRRPTSEWYYNKFAHDHSDYGRPEDEFILGNRTVAHRRNSDELTGPEELALDIIQRAAIGSAQHRDPIRLKNDALNEYARRRKAVGASVEAPLIKFLSQGVQWPPRDAHLYKVNIDAEPGAMLNLNAPVWQQPPGVMDAAIGADLLSRGKKKRLEKAFNNQSSDVTGGDLYHWLANGASQSLGPGVPPRSWEARQRLAHTMATGQLLASGVPGIRYLDGMSRSGRNRGRVTSVRTPPGENYVMFPGTEKLIRIIRRFGFVPPALYASMQGDNNEAQAGMMDFFRKAATGQPMSRRDFLRGSGQAAAAAGAARIPVPAGAGAVLPAATARLDPRAILPPAFEAGFALPNTGEQIVMLDGDAVLWGGDFYGRMSQEQMLANKLILEQARKAMPATTDRPMTFNHLTGKWHEEALRAPVPPGGDPDTWQRVFLKAGERAPDNHNMLLTEKYWPEEVLSSAYEGGTLTSPPGWAQAGKTRKAPKAYRGESPKTLKAPGDAIDRYEQDWREDRMDLLDWERRQADGTNAKELAKSDEGRQLLLELGIAPGGRYEGQVPALSPEANAMGSNIGLPGDEPTERVGRIRKLLSVGVPIAAATGISTIAQAATPEQEQARRMDFLREAMPPQGFEGRNHRIAALRESGAIPEPPPTDPFASEREAARAELSYKFQAKGMDRDVAELYATRTMELQRPTISARYVHENLDSDYDPNGAPVSPAWVLNAMSMQMALAGAGDQKTLFNKAVRSMAGMPAEQGPNGEADEYAGMIRQAALQAIEQHTPEGAYSDRSGIPQEEFDRLQESRGDNANFAYPNRLQKNFDALRQIELFTAGGDLDERETPGGTVIRGIADALYVQPGMAAANTMSPGMAPGAWAWGAAPDIKGRLAQPVSDEVGRARDALEWYRNSAPQQGPYQSYRDPDTNNARYRAYSTTTPTGLSRAMTDADRRYGRYSLPTLAFTQNPTTGKSSEIADIRLHTRRPVPIIPSGMTPEEVSQAGDAIRDYDQKSDDWFASGYAKRIGDNPTHFQNSFFNLGRNSGDIGTAGSVALGGGLGALRGVLTGSVVQGAKGFGAGLLGEAFQEGLEGTTYDTALTGAFGVNPFSKKEDNSLAVGPDGKPVQPYDPKYGATVDSNWEQARKDMDFTTGQWEATRRKNPLDRR